MSRRWRTALPLAAAALLAACAVAPAPGSSYVAQLQQPADAEVLANGMAEFVAARLPAASTTLALDPTPSAQEGNAVTPALAAALRRRASPSPKAGSRAAGAHHLRYLVSPLDAGLLVRLTIDQSTEGARFFARDSAGTLQSGGPTTVTQAEAAP